MAIFTTFDAFITSTDGTTVGAGECWDYINLIWDHLGSKYWTYPPADPSATNHGVKWGVLDPDALVANQITGLTYITNKTQLKRGDIVITTNGTYGHGGFMNEDYDPNKTSYYIYSQNFNNRRSVALDHYSINDFGGAFRYNDWNTTPPSPPIFKKGKFPWVIYANKIRGRY